MKGVQAEFRSERKSPRQKISPKNTVESGS